MKTYAVSRENKITVHDRLKDAQAVTDAQCFTGAVGLNRLAERWPAARLAKIWNLLPGSTPVRRFRDKETGVSRIWREVRSMEVTPANSRIPEVEMSLDSAKTREATSNVELPGRQASNVIPFAAPLRPGVALRIPPSNSNTTPTSRSPIRSASPVCPREGSKAGKVVAMLRRDGGATLDELVVALGWRRHTTKALLSAGGSLRKKHGLEVVSDRQGSRRAYSVRT